MERRRVGAVEIVALIDMVQSYPATAVYPNAGDALSRFGGYLDADGAVALNFAAFLLIDGQSGQTLAAGMVGDPLAGEGDHADQWDI